jgi:hypothetical protein
MKNICFSVRPRYTPGSPGSVDEELALRVASQEKESYEACLEGIYGDVDMAKAMKLGLKGIVEEMVENKGGWKVTDLITGDKFWRGSVKPSKIMRGDQLIEQGCYIEQVLGPFRQFGSKEFGFYTDKRKYVGDNGYISFNSNDLVKIERKLPEE